MKFALISLFLIFSAAVQADEPAPQVHVLQMEATFPVEMMKAPGVVLHPLSEVNKHQETIPATDRDVILDSANLRKATKNWDALEKDMLLLRAENQDAVRAANKYNGKITEANISRLKNLIAVYRKKQRAGK